MSMIQSVASCINLSVWAFQRAVSGQFVWNGQVIGYEKNNSQKNSGNVGHCARLNFL